MEDTKHVERRGMQPTEALALFSTLVLMAVVTYFDLTSSYVRSGNLGFAIVAVVIYGVLLSRLIVRVGRLDAEVRTQISWAEALMIVLANGLVGFVAYYDLVSGHDRSESQGTAIMVVAIAAFLGLRWILYAFRGYEFDDD